MRFPIFKTKIKGLTRNFNLTDPKERKKYFELKAGKEIEKLREYLKKNTFIAYLLGKKNSGKGTYSKMFAEIINPQKIDHFSIGDMIREIDKELKNKEREKRINNFFRKKLSGFSAFERNNLGFRKKKYQSPFANRIDIGFSKKGNIKKKKESSFY